MEIVFLDENDKTPVYSFEHKLEWNDRIRYDVPAKLDAGQLDKLKTAARGAFMALGCRDVARIDFRMDEQGRVYFIECNPLPGLTPGWSDLVLIAQGAGMDYRTLIGEILSGAIRRYKEREARKAAEFKDVGVGAAASGEACLGRRAHPGARVCRSRRADESGRVESTTARLARRSRGVTRALAALWGGGRGREVASDAAAPTRLLLSPTAKRTGIWLKPIGHREPPALFRPCLPFSSGAVRTRGGLPFFRTGRSDRRNLVRRLLGELSSEVGGLREVDCRREMRRLKSQFVKDLGPLGVGRSRLELARIRTVASWHLEGGSHSGVLP